MMTTIFQRATALAVPSQPAPRRENLHIFYRARVTPPAGFSAPVLRFHAAGPTEIAVNGRTLHYGPCRSREPLLYYDELQLELRTGENVFAFHQCVDREPDEAGILAELEISVNGERRFLLGAPDSFEAAYFQSYAPDAPLNSGTGYAEYVTLGGGEEAWRSGRFPGECRRTRAAARIVPPEFRQPRPIPLFCEVPREAQKIVREEDGALLLDFGRLRSGRPELSGTAAAAECVVLEYLEERNAGWSLPGGSDVMYDDRLSGVRGGFYWKGQHKRSGRYVRLRGMVPENVHFRFLEYGYPVREHGDFHSSDPFLNRLAAISAETLKLCMEDIYTDCPHRDQEQWMDALVSSRAALGLFGVRDLTRKCLLQYLSGQREDGQLYSPSLTRHGAVPDYTLLIFPFLLHYYHASGDLELLAEAHPKLERILAGFRHLEEESGLLKIEAAPPDFVYLDNTFELAKRGVSCAVNALYFRALNDFAEISELLGRQPDRKRAEVLRRTIFDRFRHPRLPDCFRDNLHRPETGFLTLNFSCELGHWDGETGVLEFRLTESAPRTRILEVADYAGYRLFLNGRPFKERKRLPDWGREPMYDPEQLLLPLEAGCNRIRFEIPWNALNWEFFLRSADGEPLVPEDAEVGENGTAMRPCRLRCWIPPELSQSTQAYAAFSGLHPEPARTLSMLRRTLRPEYPRVYKSVRVPSFCSEAGAERETEPWIMPCNTPWPTFFLLHGLFENGGANEGLEIIRHFWRDMVAEGAATTYEEWGRRSSLCHAWGASPVYFLHHDILGVRHETLHTGTLLVRPDLCDLEFAQGNVAVDPERSIFVGLRRTTAGVTEVTLRSPAGVPVRLDTSRLGECRLL